MKNKLIFMIISLFLVFSSFSVVSALDASKAPNYTWPNNTFSNIQNSDNIGLYSYSSNNIQNKEEDEFIERNLEVKLGIAFLGISSNGRYTFEYDPQYLQLSRGCWEQYFFPKKVGNTKILLKQYNPYDRNYWITTINVHIYP